MRLGQLVLLSSLLIASSAPAVALTHARRGPTSPRLTNKHAVAKPKPVFGQRTIDDERAIQLQTALIRSGYLTGEPSGHWDAESEAAMEKLQADNGWQTKLVPDSRAIIKLGLGSGSSAREATAIEAPSNPSTQTNTFSR